MSEAVRDAIRVLAAKQAVTDLSLGGCWPDPAPLAALRFDQEAGEVLMYDGGRWLLIGRLANVSADGAFGAWFNAQPSEVVTWTDDPEPVH